MSRYIMLFIIAVALSGCGMGETSYRYRMTVYIETPSGAVRSGSSVIEVASQNASDLDSFILRSGNCDNRRSVPMTQSVRGQAVEIDLGREQVIYALLKSPSGIGAEKFATTAFQGILDLPTCPDWVDEQKRVSLLEHHSAPVILANREQRNDGVATIFPTFVRFSDPLDKRTLRVLDPHSLERDLGVGYRLLLVTIQTTDEDPLTPSELGVRRRLRWLDSFEGYIDPYAPPTGIREPSTVLTDRAFRTPPP